MRIPEHWRIFMLVSALASGSAQADGLHLEHGRYPGPVLIFKLSDGQKKTIDRYRTCQWEGPRQDWMNQYSPYVLQLTAAQSRALKKKTGSAPDYFEVFETYRGQNDAGPFWNLALRFSEDQIEVPLDQVINERESQLAQQCQGWSANNPCFPDLKTRSYAYIATQAECE
ncbi:hypothetical protein [Burkholderia gladioli]|uniref:hypothetical protein n=2 Tax=Burkholderia gladioli TaxID=28095 RepID=UPI001641EB5B|nr:hypothetical protein [Burkholderia gladioli]